jgi:hypothetical protein
MSLPTIHGSEGGSLDIVLPIFYILLVPEQVFIIEEVRPMLLPTHDLTKEQLADMKGRKGREKTWQLN